MVIETPSPPSIRLTVDRGGNCSRCGQDNPAGMKFCGECGAPLPVKCTRKQVTVLCPHVCASTRISERLDPEEVHEIMDRAFEVILGAVHRYEGAINQFLGDGVMALFGASTAHDDDPYRAVRAALAIQEGLESLRADVQHTHGVDFRIRIGVHTGPIAVGVIGKGLRSDYTAVGKTTSVAARLLNFARPGQIAISATTRCATEGAFGLSDLGSMVAEDNAEALRAYAVKREIKESEQDYLRDLVEA